MSRDSFGNVAQFDFFVPQLATFSNAKPLVHAEITMMTGTQSREPALVKFGTLDGCITLGVGPLVQRMCCHTGQVGQKWGWKQIFARMEWKFCGSGS